MPTEAAVRRATRRRGCRVRITGLAPVVMVLALAAASCSASGSHPPEGSADTLVCSNPIDLLAEPIEGYESYGDVVAFPEPSTALQAVRDFDTLRVGTKLGLMVRTDAEFTLRAVDPTVEMRWGNTGEAVPATEVHVPGCPAPSWSDAEWLVYPGGIGAESRGCVEIIVEVGRSTTTAGIPLGEACEQG